MRITDTPVWQWHGPMNVYIYIYMYDYIYIDIYDWQDPSDIILVYAVPWACSCPFQENEGTTLVSTHMHTESVCASVRTYGRQSHHDTYECRKE